MNTKQILACEAQRLRKFHLLPNAYKKVGIGLLITSLLGLLVLTFGAEELPVIKTLAKNMLLLSMLIISVSRDKIEDEYTIKLRAQSYSLAFIIGVIYAIVQPYINYWAAALIKGETASFAELGVFEVLWFMLFIQIGFFYTLKLSR